MVVLHVVPVVSVLKMVLILKLLIEEFYCWSKPEKTKSLD